MSASSFYLRRLTEQLIFNCVCFFVGSPAAFIDLSPIFSALIQQAAAVYYEQYVFYEPRSSLSAVFGSASLIIKWIIKRGSPAVH